MPSPPAGGSPDVATGHRVPTGVRIRARLRSKHDAMRGVELWLKG